MNRSGFLLLFFSFITLSANAQKVKPVESTWADKIQIDGQLNDWGDSLTHYFPDQDLRYSFANDDEYLYIAVQVKNKEKQIQTAFNGLTIEINPDGKKKQGPSLIFPIPERSAIRALSEQEFNTTKDPIRMALSSVRALYIFGFPSILDGQISLDNTYGIKAEVLIDSTNILSYESVIPLSRLNLPKNTNGFAINIRINGLIRTQYTESDRRGNYRNSPYGYGGYGYPPRSRTITRERQEPGVWQYLNLAVQP